MDLLILRHGPALDRGDWDGDDRERPLSSDGRERTARILARLGDALPVDHLWTSPWRRARETAAIAGDVWGLEPEARAWLAGDVDHLEPALEALVDPCAEDAAVMLVGHEPNLGDLVGALTVGSAVPLKKAGIAWLKGLPRAGGMRLHALLPPGLVLDCSAG